MNRIISAIIIDENFLFRKGIVKQLDSKPFRMVSACTSVHELLASGSRAKPELFILGFPSSVSPAANSIAAIRERYPNSRIVVLAEDSSTTSVCEAFRHGANSYMTKSIALPTLRTSLQMVMAGLATAPVETLAMLGHGASPTPAPLIQIGAAPHHAPEAPVCAFLHSVSRGNLSDREWGVYQLLGKGCSNKVIARDLGITEATVKVHVKSIFRKTGARNRTQAAIRAIETASDQLVSAGL
jgi:two-component system nitrate/nitrite response regulator NarL